VLLPTEPVAPRMQMRWTIAGVSVGVTG
jgi:hypothetical protein